MTFDFTTLVTDRTLADVTALRAILQKGMADWTEEDRAYFWADPKGAYNATDLNRVTECMEYLTAEMESYGYTVGYREIEIEPGRTVWEEADIPTAGQIQAYIDNVRAVRDVLEMFASTPQVPDDVVASGLTVEKANDIERILLDVEEVIQRVVRAFPRLNAHTFWSGNRPLPSAESDRGRTWAELDLMNTTWRNWQVADWYLLLYGNLKAEGDVT